MSAWLSGWLRDIILIILFAAFIDLLIPNNALQRYVKVAISLMILLTILSPVIRLLKADVEIRQAAETAFATVSAGSSTGNRTGSGSMPPLGEVLEAGGKLKLDAESRTARLVEEQMETMIRDQLYREYGVNAERVDVRIGPGSELSGESAEVKQVRIVLKESNEKDEAIGTLEAAEAANAGADDRRKRSGTDGVTAEVARIEPVDIRVTIDSPGRQRQLNEGETEAQSAVPAAAESADDAPNKLLLKRQIVEGLREWWGINKDLVSVEWV